MSMDPPPFQEASRCDVCNCSFGTFRRRHHCRCCGRTLCYEHSSNQMALPQFGIYSNVRVCADCFNNSRSGKDGPLVSSDAVNSVADTISKLDVESNAQSRSMQNAENRPVLGIKECKCGMPLCICEAPAPSADAVPEQKKSISVVAHQSNPKPKKSDNVPKNRSSTSNKFSSTFNLGHATDSTSDRPQMDYEVNGEGLREAIKNGDIAAVKKLLNEGVDANYRDKQGLSLLHLAALFNQTDIVFVLMDSGASLEYKNAQGETPFDCAPATLQYKMQNKMEEGRAKDQRT